MDLSQVWMTAPHWAQGASPFFSRPIWEVLVNITVVIPKWMASNSLVIFQRVAVGFPGCDLFVFCLCKGFGFFGFRVFEASWQNMRLQAQALTCDAEWPAARTNPQTTVCQYKNSQRTADLKTFSFVMNLSFPSIQQKNCLSQMLSETYLHCAWGDGDNAAKVGLAPRVACPQARSRLQVVGLYFSKGGNAYMLGFL